MKLNLSNIAKSHGGGKINDSQEILAHASIYDIGLLTAKSGN